MYMNQHETSERRIALSDLYFTDRDALLGEINDGVEMTRKYIESMSDVGGGLPEVCRFVCDLAHIVALLLIDNQQELPAE